MSLVWIRTSVGGGGGGGDSAGGSGAGGGVFGAAFVGAGAFFTGGFFCTVACAETVDARVSTSSERTSLASIERPPDYRRAVWPKTGSAGREGCRGQGAAARSRRNQSSVRRSPSSRPTVGS